MFFFILGNVGGGCHLCLYFSFLLVMGRWEEREVFVYFIFGLSFAR